MKPHLDNTIVTVCIVRPLRHQVQLLRQVAGTDTQVEVIHQEAVVAGYVPLVFLDCSVPQSQLNGSADAE